MLTNRMRFVVDVLTEGMVHSEDEPVVAQRIARSLMDWAMNSESGLVADLPSTLEDEPGAYTLAIQVFAPVNPVEVKQLASARS